MFNIELVGSAAFEAITVDEIKAHARIYTTADDSYLSTLVVAARENVEQDLNRVVVGQQYLLHLDQWLGYQFWDRYFHYDVPYYNFNAAHWYPKIVLPVMPIQSVESITYTDTDGNPQTLDTSLYQLRTYHDPVEIILLNDGSMPDIQTFSTIDIAFTAGYASADDVPEMYKHAIKFLASHWYEHREAASETSIKEVPHAYERIINRLRIKRFR